jgi:hypothetical protein
MFSKRLAYAVLAVASLVAVLGLSATAASAKPSARVAPCPNYAFTHPFLPWLDPGNYFLPPGASFESSSAGWTLTGGAKTVAGNEPFYVTDDGDGRSLSLPAGSSATTPAVCVSLDSPDLRLFVRNTGSLLSLLKVELDYTGLDGKPKTATVALVAGGKAWAPSLPLPFLLSSVLPIVGDGGQTWVSFIFSPTGLTGSWQIDDVYVDPLKNH